MRYHVPSLANRVAALLMKSLFACVARVHVVRSENANHDGAFLLAANHISHFDPFIISSVVRRKIDWMAMAEFFPLPLLGVLLRAVDAFPANRDRADRATIRSAIERLKNGRIIGLFPEGGIRCGARSCGSPSAIRSRIFPIWKSLSRARALSANWPPRSNFCTPSCANAFRSRQTISRIHQESECIRNRAISSTTKTTKDPKGNKLKKALFHLVIFLPFTVQPNDRWCDAWQPVASISLCAPRLMYFRRVIICTHAVVGKWRSM